MTAHQLWNRTKVFVHSVMPTADAKTINEVARKVYDQMKFLVETPADGDCDGR